MKLGEGGFWKRIGKEDMIKILYEILKNKQKEALKLKTSWLAEFTQILTLMTLRTGFLGLKTAHKAL